jgi:hypothetical protein
MPDAKFDGSGLTGVANIEHKRRDIRAREVIPPLEVCRGNFVLPNEAFDGLFHPTLAHGGFFGRFNGHTMLSSIAG